MTFKWREGKRILKDIPDDWGRKLSVHQGAVTNTRTGPNAIRMKARAYYVLVMFTAQTARHLALNSDHIVRGGAPIGSLEIVPQGADLYAQWESPKENMLLALSEERLRTLAGREYQVDDFEFRPPRLGVVDAKALMIARNIRSELQVGEFAVDECIDAWLTILAIHLLREYSNLSDKSTVRSKGGLAPGTWRRLDEFIRANLSEKVTLDRLAEVAQLSPSHFARSFRESIGQSPHQYVLSLRLDIARKLITSKNTLPLEEVARISGFSSNSHLSATMKRFLGIRPTQLRRNEN